MEGSAGANEGNCCWPSAGDKSREVDWLEVGVEVGVIVGTRGWQKSEIAVGSSILIVVDWGVAMRAKQQNQLDREGDVPDLMSSYIWH